MLLCGASRTPVGLAADDHLVITAERMGQFGVYRLKREGELGLVREAQQFQVQSR
jgi:hypothetical protein